jgi:hypothetical protein
MLRNKKGIEYTRTKKPDLTTYNNNNNNYYASFKRAHTLEEHSERAQEFFFHFCNG